MAPTGEKHFLESSGIAAVAPSSSSPPLSTGESHYDQTILDLTEMSNVFFAFLQNILSGIDIPVVPLPASRTSPFLVIGL